MTEDQKGMLVILETLDLNESDREIVRLFLIDNEYRDEIVMKAARQEPIPPIIEKYCWETIQGIQKAHKKLKNFGFFKDKK